MFTLRTALAAGLAWVLLSTLAQAQGPKVIFSNIASSATSDVPGVAGLKFKPGATSSTAFDRPFVSPDGSRWVLGGFVDAAAADDDVIITGMGPTAAGASIVVRAGTPTSFNPFANYNVINSHMGINNAGAIAFSGTTTAASSQFVGLANGGVVTLIANQGGAAPVIGKTWTATLNGANVLGSGTVAFQGTTTPTPTDYLGMLGTTIIVQSGVTVPTGQLDSGTRTVNVLTSNSWRMDDTGTNFMYRTTLTGGTAGTNTIVAVNNQVVAQLGLPVPGWTNTANVVSLASEASSLILSPTGGNWAIRGAVNDGTGAANQTDFVLINGSVVAGTDQPIFAGATELFDDSIFAQTFFVNTVNGNGDFVIGGVTNNPDVTRNAVLVFNNRLVIAREFDPVDLDGNGMFDDGVFIDIFGNDDGVLTNDLNYYFVASLRDASGTAVGNALLHINISAIPEPTTVSFLAASGAAVLVAGQRWRRQRCRRRSR